ncbi:TPA: glycosyltransferase [Klebsiella pneumoniae]
MKVLHAAEVVKGGVSTVMRQLLEDQYSWDKIGKVVCVIPENQKEELSPYHTKSGMYFFKRKKRGILSFISFIKAFILCVLREKPDIVHLHSTFSGVLGRLCLFILRPIVKPVVIYCPHAFSFMMTNQKIKKKIYVAIEKILQKNTDAIICVSKYELEESIKYGFDKSKLILIYNGVPRKRFYDKKTTGNNINLLFIGRLDYQKGFDILISAMEKTINGNIKLTVVGDSDDSNVKKNSDSIKYVGWVAPENIEQYYREADLVVVPSRWEGFAMVPLEAMSYGLPVISSDATSLPEAIKHRVTGYLFKSESASNLTDVLDKLDLIEAKKLGENALIFFEEHFQSIHMLKEVKELYLIKFKIKDASDE